MTELLVDFPSHRPTSTKRILFSKTSELKFVKHIGTMADTNKIWYPSKDYKAMRVELKKSVQGARKALDSFSSTNQGLVDGVIFTGVENLVTLEMIKRTQDRRDQHINAVLKEQGKQKSVGIYDADRLAHVSYQYSKSSGARAFEIGKLNAR